MKKLMITTALLCGLLTVGYTQDLKEKHKKNPEERAQLMTASLEKKLNLTSDQKSKIYEINLDRAKKMDDLNETYRKEKIEKRKKLMEGHDKKLNKVLTSDQQKSYEEFKAQHRERMQKRHQHENQRMRN
ncbi:MAG: hypothetical protein WBP45_04485 [Daejeonella sp.]